MSIAEERKVLIEGTDALARQRSAEDAVQRLEDRIAGDLPPKENLTASGPRNLPKPGAKKKARVTARQSRRVNRPVKRRKSRSRREGR